MEGQRGYVDLRSFQEVSVCIDYPVSYPFCDIMDAFIVAWVRVVAYDSVDVFDAAAFSVPKLYQMLVHIVKGLEHIRHISNDPECGRTPRRGLDEFNEVLRSFLGSCMMRHASYDTTHYLAETRTPTRYAAYCFDTILTYTRQRVQFAYSYLNVQGRTSVILKSTISVIFSKFLDPSTNQQIIYSK
ncbi:hypothetical protein SODALDRAFT_360155 [Sodiomyces alkalinus F11]|uniref:Uncharacterized protein n=1 Tax=Sodiomyces alkalinus (strain CBS 110278 / VKM F-3762 / F11) TaxID=1314773 RepID=A0A3N2PTN2_SODAK|nr:hypothetical protein SODALDRAFT_360155 [Sodiomyces alkalinus F11]ROT37867.1 hypothetical protein SODALDRAFT_360155 [Sodiomyces alkalinus F11]